MSSTFTLRKWYFDLVTDEGVTWIGYSGEVRYRGVRVPFSSAFRGGEAAESSLHASPPRETPDALAWSADALDVNYDLSRMAAPFERCLHETPRGSVQWQCRYPAGRATLRLRDGELRGFGYAELLTMTLAPWSLPLDTLRWGRFVTAQSSLAWIRWEGAEPRAVAYRDGHPVTVREIGDDMLLVGDRLELRMTERRGVREEQLGETLRPLGPLRALLPARLTGSRETKWISRAVLTEDGRVLDEGWAIHERVTFPAT